MDTPKGLIELDPQRLLGSNRLSEGDLNVPSGLTLLHVEPERRPLPNPDKRWRVGYDRT